MLFDGRVVSECRGWGRNPKNYKDELILTLLRKFVHNRDYGSRSSPKDTTIDRLPHVVPG